jgi:hypothetical protein
MNDAFVPKTMPDTRGAFEKLFPQVWDEALAEHGKHTPLAKRMDIICKRFETTPTEAALVHNAYRTCGRAVLEVIGRHLDEVGAREGLQMIAYAMMLDGLSNMLAAMVTSQNEIVTANILMSEMPTTPGCECVRCEIVRLFNKQLARREAVVKARGQSR